MRRLIFGLATYLVIVVALNVQPAREHVSDPVGLAIVASIIAMLVAGRRPSSDKS
jgi:hypothetical protein